jgi:hypothetical protein
MAVGAGAIAPAGGAGAFTGSELPDAAGAAAFAVSGAAAGAELVSVPPAVSGAGAEEPQATETAAVNSRVKNRITNLLVWL